MAVFLCFGAGFFSGFGGVESIRLSTSSGVGAGGACSGLFMTKFSKTENTMRR